LPADLNPGRPNPLVDEKEFDSKTGLSRAEKFKILGIYGSIAVATCLGLTASVVIGRISLVLAGLGVAAYVFGLRHGADADHIVAIDNTTRKLMQQKERPLTVGMWFSLGHSTVVVCLIVALVVATKAIMGYIPDLQHIGALVGTSVSGIFLWLIGLINIVIVLGIYRIFRGLREGRLNPLELENLLNKRGFMNRYFSSLFRIVRKPWQIFPIGILFGLGFDTASEIGLIALSVGIGVSSSVPMWMILVLPFMFTCGMVLVDTTDGVMMRVAYGWAFLQPLRKIYYNLTVTVISVLVAIVIGTVELLQVVSRELSLNGAFWGWVASLDFGAIGFGIIGLFIGSWAASIIYWRYKRFDEPFIR